ncbi:fibrinogen alpha chain [Oryzias melastigma]|uniref:fibrinogen alpha chain n=1 Tax=Oryzias melastigma TaxID=30732 RepID=UPI000CF7E9CF|nr:fibrinogen alpha chain [Oryzias melastigma]
MSQMEMDVDRKLQTVCETAKTLEEAAEKSMARMTQVYNSHRRVIVSRYVSEQKFAARADVLAKKLTSLQEKSKVLDVKIKELRSKVKKQVEELYRTEVDVDMMLRACGGSCPSRTPFSVDHHSSLQSESMLEVLHQRSRVSPPPTAVKKIKLQPLENSLKPSTDYKSIPTVRKEVLTQFEDVDLNRFSLEGKLDDSEGSNEVE